MMPFQEMKKTKTILCWESANAGKRNYSKINVQGYINIKQYKISTDIFLPL